MTENEKKVNKNSVLFENEQYNLAIADKDQTIAEKDTTISILEKQIGERDRIINSKNKEIDIEKVARKEAENQVLDQKQLEKTSASSHVYKTEDEKFSDSFMGEWSKLKNSK